MTTPAPPTLPAPQGAKRAVSKHRRAARDEIKKGVRHLERSIGEIQKGLRKAEREIEADARARVRALRKEGRAQLAVKRSADVILAEAVGAAALKR